MDQINLDSIYRGLDAGQPTFFSFLTAGRPTICLYLSKKYRTVYVIAI